MQNLYSFDRVHDTIKVYRTLMNALSHPGRKERLLKDVGDFGPYNQGFLAIAATLLDAEVSFFVDGDGGLAERITEITYSKEAPVSQADYIFVPKALNDNQLEEIFSHAKYGTFSDPHLSATVILTSPDENYIKSVLQVLKEQNIPYPLGMDLLFILGEMEIIAVPRLIKEGF